MAVFPDEVGSSGDLAFKIGTANVEIPQPDGSVMADERRYLTLQLVTVERASTDRK